MQDDKKAESSYREALQHDPRLMNSHLGLGKIYQRQEKFAPALAEIDSAVKLDPARPDLHYVRGQLLLRMGRKQEAKKELEAATALSNEHPGQKEKQETVPSPELLQDPP